MKDYTVEDAIAMVADVTRLDVLAALIQSHIDGPKETVTVQQARDIARLWAKKKPVPNEETVKAIVDNAFASHFDLAVALPRDYNKKQFEADIKQAIAAGIKQYQEAANGD
jgi:hypothetical protein